MKEVSENDINLLVKHQLKLDVTSISSIENGYNSRVYRLMSDMGGFVLRMQPQSTNGFESEKHTLQRLRSTSSQILPEVLETGILANNSDIGFSLARLLPGIDLLAFIQDSSVIEEKKILALNNLGMELHKIHSISSSRFGLIDEDGNGQFETGQEWYFSILERLENAIKSSQISELDIEVPAIDTSSLKDIHPTITHGDFVPRNILVDPESSAITGIVDFESSKSHAPELDIAYWKFYWSGDEATNELIKTYSGQLNNELVSSLAVIRGLDALAYWLEMGNKDNATKVLRRLRSLTNVNK